MIFGQIGNDLLFGIRSRSSEGKIPNKEAQLFFQLNFSISVFKERKNKNKQKQEYILTQRRFGLPIKTTFKKRHGHAF